jgi:hypothetical protein
LGFREEVTMVEAAEAIRQPFGEAAHLVSAWASLVRVQWAQRLQEAEVEVGACNTSEL